MAILKAALEYQARGYPVIPIRKDPDPDKDKKPHIKWKKYQEEKPTVEDIKKWWGKWPNAMIGLITGKASGKTVLDPDTQAGIDCLDEFIPDSLEVPTVLTPGGGRHYWFEYVPGIPNRSRLDGLIDTDARNDGGYVIIPPSVGINGKPYKWLNGLEIGKINPPSMPEILRDVILQGAGHAKASNQASVSIKNGTILYNKNPYIEGVNIASTFPENMDKSTSVNKSQNLFVQGHRDESLFHLANCLVKGGMSEENIRNYILFFASNCKPPFPEKETLIKIESALKRKNDRSRNLTATIREVIESTSGNISSTFILQSSTKSTLPEDRRKVSAILSRMVKEGFIERVNNQNGLFRRIESDCQAEDWQTACTDTVDLWLPFGLNEMISIMPGSIILFAGAQDAGKSAVQMNIAKENRHAWNVHYFSSELNAAAFKNRMTKFPDLAIDQCNIQFYPRSKNFHDVIKRGENDLNIIDYLEIHSEFWEVAKYLARIHEKLGKAVCVVALQKDPQALYGRGGSFTQEKPILSVALDHGKATISKFKGEFKGENPRGKEYYFKLVDGCKIVKGSGWHRPPPKQ